MSPCAPVLLTGGRHVRTKAVCIMRNASILDAERLSFSAAARRLKVHVSTVWRWATTGVRGRVLPTVEIGGRRFILVSDLEQFICPAGASTGTQAAADAERELESLGL